MERIGAHCYCNNVIFTVTCPRINNFIIGIFQSELCSLNIVSADILLADFNITLGKVVSHHYTINILTVNSYFSF